MGIVVALGGKDAFGVNALADALKDARGAPDPGKVATDALKIYAVLGERGFNAPELIYAFCAREGDGPNTLADKLTGFFYFKDGSTWQDGKALYQAIALFPGT